MRIMFEYYLDADYDDYKDDYSEDVAEDVERLGEYYTEEYDDFKKAEYAWNMAGKIYRDGGSAHHISQVEVETDDGSATVDIDDGFFDFYLQDVIDAAKDAISNGKEYASICGFVNARETSQE